MEKNDIFNTNLLQLPMKAQVADEGAVQDIAPVAAPADLAGGAVELELEAPNQRGVVLQRLSDVTPKKCEKLASGFLHRGEITQCWHPDVCSAAKSRSFAVTAV